MREGGSTCTSSPPPPVLSPSLSLRYGVHLGGLPSSARSAVLAPNANTPTSQRGSDSDLASHRKKRVHRLSPLPASPSIPSHSSHALARRHLSMIRIPCRLRRPPLFFFVCTIVFASPRLAWSGQRHAGFGMRLPPPAPSPSPSQPLHLQSLQSPITDRDSQRPTPRTDDDHVSIPIAPSRGDPPRPNESGRSACVCDVYTEPRQRTTYPALPPSS
ncbi:hypothetical protein OF83DRAFT_730425 [Amylostereum chailletii]|nr:hypothetical protein OF83DRAFT_730425 [Amylostereum chailletii]